MFWLHATNVDFKKTSSCRLYGSRIKIFVIRFYYKKLNYQPVLFELIVQVSPAMVAAYVI